MTKRAGGWWLAGQLGDGRSALPLYRRIAERLLRAIQSGELPPGSRLPSARQLARDWGVSRGTVDEAFAHLQADAWLVRDVGRGSFVARELPRRPPLPRPRREPNEATRAVLARLEPIAANPTYLSPYKLHGLRLLPQVVDLSQFPLAAWRQRVAQALQEPQRTRFGFGPVDGAPELREALARHLALARGLPCSASQIVITSGTAQSLNVVAQALLQPGSTVCVPDPGYLSTPRGLTLLHHRVVGMPVAAEGIDVEAARRAVPRPALIAVAPCSQHPLGVRLSPRRRRALLDWARESGAWVLEHEWLAEVDFDGAQPPPLAAEDDDDSVLLMGNLGSVMYPSVGLSYLVAPAHLVPSLAVVRGLYGEHSPVPIQLAAARFIDDGLLAAHVRRLRAVYAQRRAALVQALAQDATLAAGMYVPPAGVNVCVALPRQLADRPLADKLLTRGLAPGILSAHGLDPTAFNGLVLGFGGDEPATIEAAVHQLRETMHACQA